MVTPTKQVFVPDEFFKVYDPRLCCEHLRIPLAFVECFKGNIHVISELEGLAGRSWKVTLEKVEPDVFIKGGWPDFVRDSSLEFGEFLTFSFDGKSKFKVKVYGINGCIKEDSTAIKERDASTSQNKPKAAAQRILCSCKVVMQQSYIINSLLNMPAKFGNRFLDGKARFEKWGTLQTDSVSGRFVFGRSSDRLQLRKGWGDFMRENNLRVGDVCHFKLTDEEKMILEVRIEKLPRNRICLG